jgi:acyl carrier protein
MKASRNPEFDFGAWYHYNYCNLRKISKGGCPLTVDEVFDRVKTIISEKLGVEEDEIAMDSDLTEDLGADSLDLVDLVMALEDEFDFKVEDEQIENISTVGDIVESIGKGLGVED